MTAIHQSKQASDSESSAGRNCRQHHCRKFSSETGLGSRGLPPSPLRSSGAVVALAAYSNASGGPECLLSLATSADSFLGVYFFRSVAQSIPCAETKSPAATAAPKRSLNSLQACLSAGRASGLGGT